MRIPVVYVDLRGNQGNREVLLNDEGRGSFFCLFKGLKVILMVEGGQEVTVLELQREDDLHHEIHFLLKN